MVIPRRWGRESFGVRNVDRRTPEQIQTERLQSIRALIEKHQELQHEISLAGNILNFVGDRDNHLDPSTGEDDATKLDACLGRFNAFLVGLRENEKEAPLSLNELKALANA